MDVFLLNHSIAFLPARPPQLAASFFLAVSGTVPFRSHWSLLITPCAGPDTFPQEKVFEDKLSFPRNKRAAASAANYLAVICLGTGFDLDDFIEGLAVRARE
jgi:hypothetical protein